MGHLSISDVHLRNRVMKQEIEKKIKTLFDEESFSFSI